MRTCLDCAQGKPLSEFDLHEGVVGWYARRCRDCVRAAARQKYRKYREQNLQWHRRDRAANPLKARARSAVANAIRAGKLARAGCEVCGAKADAHHADYTRPLAVRWLCRKHHFANHVGPREPQLKVTLGAKK